MSAGALRCYRILTWFHRRGKQCFMSLKRLAEDLRCSVRQVKRWTRELAELGYLTKQRCGPHPNVYMVVEDKICGNVESGPSLSPLSGAHKSLGISELVSTETKQAVPKSEPKPEPPRWSNTEREAVRQSIARFRYTSGMRCNPEPFLGRLERIAAFYSASGHRVAMEFDQVYERVQRSPSTAPEKAVWFMAVLEARLKRKISKPVERVPSLTLRRYGVSEEYKSNQEAMRMNEETRRDLEKRRAEAKRAQELIEQEFAVMQAKEKKDEGRMIPPKFIGWDASEMAAHYQELDEFLDFQAKGGTMAEFLRLPGHGAGEPVAQSSAPEPTTDIGRELYDTQALIRGVAKSMEERPASATMEEIYQQLNDKRAS